MNKWNSKQLLFEDAKVLHLPTLYNTNFLVFFLKT
jgi:hypothetical protein